MSYLIRPATPIGPSYAHAPTALLPWDALGTGRRAVPAKIQALRRYSDDVHSFLEAMIDEAHEVQITSAIQACRDRRDDRFLELAIDGNAGVILSGDADLLALNPFRGIPILRLREFME
ncbi:MAG: putative toxin-antitoxin system toxin component, PIN family [Chromatiales bacterium]|nr:putative toxin-antitoxin system toxin component, PIN family [Chromatiales bacterium]